MEGGREGEREGGAGKLGGWKAKGRGVEGGWEREGGEEWRGAGKRREEKEKEVKEGPRWMNIYHIVIVSTYTRVKKERFIMKNIHTYHPKPQEETPFSCLPRTARIMPKFHLQKSKICCPPRLR